MSLSRREFLRLGGFTAVAASTTACSAIGRELVQRELPESLTIPVPEQEQIDPIHRLLNRAGYGPRPGDRERVAAMGLSAYLEEQLHPEQIEDTATDVLMRSLTLTHMDVSQLVEQDQKDGVVELIGSALTRALVSKRQLYEAMVEFWSDHFNIYLRKNKFMPLLKIVDDRDVIRPHALGKFRDLLHASARSPAMLAYLDNTRNNKKQPNENYGRELLELHTLGVYAGYTQKDVQEVARILTGWTVARQGRQKGYFVFRPGQHDFGAKVALGQTFHMDDGEAEVTALLDMLVDQPATSEFIATKLVRRFVADEPPPGLTERVAQTFRRTDGDIKEMLRVIFLSEEFATAPPKLKRPYTYLVSLMRALHATVRPTRERVIGHALAQMGQLPFHWPPPDGYPDVSTAWAANLLPRWNFALAVLHEEMPGINAPLEEIMSAGKAETAADVLNLFAGLVYGRALQPHEAAQFHDYTGSGPLSDHQTQLRLRDSVALMLAAPAFQWT
ncbi:MAG: DUF1800 domain-containing protein [Chloroflexi bacterium]|nr:DUF1800 domain-containing protein [Chloroflexota bacterium]